MAAALALLLAFAAAGDARTRKGDKLLAEGKKAEAVSDWDKALQSYQKAFAEDPSDQRYDMAVKRARFQAAEAHIHQGRKLREQGELEKALAEFEKAYAIDPSSAIAEQELKRTLEMIERAKKGAQTGQAVPPDERILTPGELEKKREGERLARLEAAPELKSFPHQPISLRMSNQPPKVLFETVGKLA
jgi:general secretion pathway protein D